MPLTSEQVKELKNQLKSQVQHLPESKKNQALEQIDSLSAEALEQMLEEQKSSGAGKSKPIFRAIIDREIQSVIIAESPSALAVLDINPISPGHTLVIPKIAVKDARYIPTSAFSLAKRIGKIITSKLKSKSIDIQTETKFGESIIHIIPQYSGQENLQSARSKATPDNLQLIAKKIQIKKRIVKKKIEQSTKPVTILWKSRIP